jgi:hypothetical protein
LFNKARLRVRPAAFAAAISVLAAAGVGGAYFAGQAFADNAGATKVTLRLVDLRVAYGAATQHSGAIQASVTPAPGLLHRTAFDASAPFQFAGVADSSRDVDCLTAAVYYEARGETAAGQAAVAQVVLNRVRHPAFPKTVCGVVYQGVGSGTCQFSFACDGAADRRREPAAWARARSVAQQALNGYVMAGVGHATHFHLASLGVAWSGQMIRIAQVGQHVFYAFGGRHSALAARAVSVSDPAPDAPPPGPPADGGAIEVAVAAEPPATPTVKPAADVAAAQPPAQAAVTTPS